MSEFSHFYVRAGGYYRGKNRAVLISSYTLGELEKIAAHYGIVRGGGMIKETTVQGAAVMQILPRRIGDFNKTQTKLESFTNIPAVQYSHQVRDH